MKKLDCQDNNDFPDGLQCYAGREKWYIAPSLERIFSIPILTSFRVLFFSIIALAVLVPFKANGQFINGITVDGKNQPLPYALIYLTEEPNGLQAGYAASDSLGYWRINISKPSTYKLIVRYLGCKEQEYEINWNGRDTLFYHTKLEVDSIFLKEIFIKGERPEAIVIDDTIRYPAHWYADSTEISLGDLINKIPGASYSPQDGIIYGGKRVTKVFIENRDLFLDQHHLAADGVPAKLIEALDFNINYQTLRNHSREGEYKEVALNIRLNEEGRSTLMGLSEGEAGVPGHYKGAGSILSARKRSGFSVFGRVNNMGIPLMTTSEYTKLVPSINRYILKNAEQMVQSGNWDIVPDMLSMDDRVLANLDKMIAGVYEYEIKPDKILRLTGYTSQIWRNRESYLERTYFSNLDHILLGQKVQENEGGVISINGHMEWQFNPKLYVEITIPFLRSAAQVDELLDGKFAEDQIYFSGNHKVRQIIIAPEFYVRYKLNNRFTIRINGLYQNEWRKSDRSLEDIIPILNLSETAQSGIFRFDQNGNALIRRFDLELGCHYSSGGPWSYQLKIMSNQLRHYESSFSSLPQLNRFDGDLNFLKRNVILNPEGIYESKVWMGKIGIRLYTDQLFLNSEESKLMTVLPYMSLKYNLSKFHYFLFKLNEIIDRSDPTHVWKVEHISEPWISTLGQYEINESMFSRSVNLTYNRISFHPAMKSLIVGGSYADVKNGVTQVITSNEDNQFQVKWIGVPHKAMGNVFVNYQAKVSKRIQMNGRLQWSRTDQKLLDSGAYMALKNNLWFASFRFNVSLNKMIDLGLRCQFTRSYVATVGLNSFENYYQSLVPGIQLKLNISPQWTITSSFSTLFNTSSIQQVERFDQLNVSLAHRITGKPVEFVLNGYNVLNVNRQALLQVETNPVFFGLSTYKTFPSIFTLGLRWYFP